MARAYRVVISKTRGGLKAAATRDWTILDNTVKQFAELDSNDDAAFGDIGGVLVKEPGWVALAYIDFDDE